MKKYINGEIVEMTAAEIEMLEDAAARADAEERRRAMTTEEVSRLLIAQQINTLVVDDNTALRMKEFYPEWAAGADYPAGFKVQRGGKLCLCLQAHTSMDGWEPENAPALWEYVNEVHDGSKYDPIPYDGNMELTEGLYYTQDGVLYRCTRATGIPVYHTLTELIGVYVEMVA